MKRIAMLIAAAALLNACGGGSDQAESQASASNESMAGTSAAGSISSSPYRVAAPQGIVINRVDPRLRGRSGEVEVWVSLQQNSVAAERAALAESSGMTTAQGGELAKAMGAVRKAAADHRQRIGESQAALASNIASVGGRELARVQVAHNAIAVRVDASQLEQLALIPGVAKVRPVLNYEMSLSETVPYVGGAAVQASGETGTGVTVAVLDSGIDYTHRNLGGAGHARRPMPPRTARPRPIRCTTTLDGLFPDCEGDRRLRLRRRGLAERLRAHRGPGPDRFPGPRHARGRHHRRQECWTVRMSAWRPAPSCSASRSAAPLRRRATASRCCWQSISHSIRTVTATSAMPLTSSTCRSDRITARSKTT